MLARSASVRCNFLLLWMTLVSRFSREPPVTSGFSSAGMGPAFGEGRDLLLLQYLSEPLDTSKLQLFTQLAKDLVTFIDLLL